MNTDTEDCTLTLTETNSHGWIPICACGWTGIVHNNPAHKKAKRNSKKGTGDDYEPGK